MKLYATTTSERATKGQGGNTFIRIELFTGDAKNSLKIADILLDSHNFIYFKDGKNNEMGIFMGTPKGTLEEITKGKQ